MSPAARDPLEEFEALLAQSHRVGRYVIERELGHGGMATVYLAHRDDAPDAACCVKVIHPHLAADEALARMFLHEARLLARIDHPNVCRVRDFGEDGGSHYLVMDYVRGATLAALIARAGAAGLEPALAARIAADVARGLHAAHELADEGGASAMVVHRDVSPANVFVGAAGVAQIGDFGVARSADPTRALTRAGDTRGTPGYMAPEQARGEPVDRRADVFALGVVLWEATLGRRLFARRGELETLRAVAAAEVPPPSSARTDYPPALERVVMRCLARAPAARFATAAELAEALERVARAAAPPADHARVAAAVAPLLVEAPAAGSVVHDEDAAPRPAPAALRAAPAADEDDDAPFDERDPGEVRARALEDAPTRVLPPRARASAPGDGSDEPPTVVHRPASVRTAARARTRVGLVAAGLLAVAARSRGRRSRRVGPGRVRRPSPRASGQPPRHRRRAR